ncbi:MAG: amidohydrolase family protein [Mycolicibacterium neoaurum]|uniref:N-acyl-D-amino-acid deacylase family protein n=1 Tax=Mycolicibacterium neoaurum TaxID=1795 RepID=UPI002FF7611B
MLDTLITGARVIDGTGAPGRPCDVGILDGRIVHVGTSPHHEAAVTVDAGGLLLTPGFIDPHSHTDWSVLGNPEAHSTIRQGVTTEVVGNCGVTYAPLHDADVPAAQSALASLGYTEQITWRSFGELLDTVHGGGTTQNLMWFVGHTALRTAAASRAAHDGVDRRAELIRLLEAALEAGAIGFSSGLEYGSGRFADTDELAELASVCGKRDGMYSSHIRNRDTGLAAAVDEFFDVVHRGGVRAQISHLNVRHGTGASEGAWHDAVQRVVTERARGCAVLADMTPYPDGIGMATGLLPPWLADRPATDIAELLRDSDIRRRVREDSDRYWRFIHRGQWDRVRLGVSATHPQWEGLSFPRIAELAGKDEWDCLFDVLSAAGPDIGSVQLLGELFTEEHLAEAIGHDHFLLGVDAFSARSTGPLGARTRHPLFYYGHTHYLAHHVPAGTLTLEDAVHRMTGKVADHFGITGRGRITEGHHADLVLIDPDILARTDTWSLPDGYADAARHVWVNGVAVVTDAVHTGSRPGQLLPRN